MILKIHAVFSCSVYIAAVQLASSFVENNSCTGSFHGAERDTHSNRKDEGFEQAITICSNCGGFVTDGACIQDVHPHSVSLACPVHCAHFTSKAPLSPYTLRLCFPPHDVSLISINPVPHQNKLCWSALGRDGRGEPGEAAHVGSAQAPPLAGQRRQQRIIQSPLEDFPLIIVPALPVFAGLTSHKTF